MKSIVTRGKVVNAFEPLLINRTILKVYPDDDNHQNGANCYYRHTDETDVEIHSEI